MRNEEYWAMRSAEREALWFERSQQEIERELARYYASSLRQIQKNIDALYGRYAKDNALDRKTAQKLIRGKEFAEWRMSMKEYLKKAGTGDKKILLELNTLAMKSRISRLEQLQGETMMELAKLAEKSDTAMTAFLKKAYEENYYQGIFDIAKRIPTSSAFAHVDTKHLEEILRMPWSGANYSERIWNNTEKLAQVVKETVVQGIHRGSSVQKMAKAVQREKLAQDVSKKMDGGLSQCVTLVRTELSYVENSAALDSIKEAGLRSFEFVATLDRKTSETCREHDGKVYPIEEAVQGDNVPPLHTRCRSTIVGALRGRSLGGKRIARDENDRPMYVPADMTYPEWKAIYVEKTQTIEKWEEARMAAPLILGGKSCSVDSKTQHTFSLGEKGNETELLDSVVYTTPDGHNFVFPKEYDHNLQQITPEDAVAAWFEVPDFIRKKAQKTIEFVDYFNPKDAKWQKLYNTNRHVFSAGGKKITFFRNDVKGYTKDDLIHSYCHESAHYLDRNMRIEGKEFYSRGSEWTKAKENDKLFSGYDSPSDYGINENIEDFAESVYYFAIDRQWFVSLFPNRAAIIKKLYGLRY